jgi:hypothetical protein
MGAPTQAGIDSLQSDFEATAGEAARAAAIYSAQFPGVIISSPEGEVSKLLAILELIQTTDLSNSEIVAVREGRRPAELEEEIEVRGQEREEAAAAGDVARDEAGLPAGGGTSGVGSGFDPAGGAPPRVLDSLTTPQQQLALSMAEGALDPLTGEYFFNGQSFATFDEVLAEVAASVQRTISPELASTLSPADEPLTSIMIGDTVYEVSENVAAQIDAARQGLPAGQESISFFVRAFTEAGVSVTAAQIKETLENEGLLGINRLAELAGVDLALGGGGRGGGGGPAPKKFGFVIGPDGQLIRTDPSTGAAEGLGFEAPTETLTINDQKFQISSDLAAQIASDLAQFGAVSESTRAQIEESARQFDDSLAQDILEFDLIFPEGVRQFDATLNEDTRQFNEQLTESVREFNIGTSLRAAEIVGQNARFNESQRLAAGELAESARQAELGSATSRFNALTQLLPQLGRLSLDTAEMTRRILSEGTDFLARAFAQRGETAPLPQVTQADQLNAVRQGLTGANALVGQFAPGATRGFDPFQPSAVNVDPLGFNQGGGFAGGNPLRTREDWVAHFLSQGMTPEAAQAGADAQVRAGAATGMVQAPPVYGALTAPEAPVTPTPPATGAGGPDVPGATAIVFGDGTPGFEMDGKYYTRKQLENALNVGAFNPPAATPVPVPVPLPAPAPAVDNTRVPLPAPLPQHLGPAGGAPGFQRGGTTTATQFQVGEPVGGFRPNVEIVENPTGAPLRIIPVGAQAQAGIVGFEHGTGASGSQQAPDAVRPPATGFQPARALPSSAQPPPAPVPAFTLPNIPVPDEVTQAQLIADARAFSPPAVNALLANRRPRPQQFGFALPTPGQLGSLTTQELAAFNTRIGVEFNTTLEDVETAINRRFGGTRTAPRGGFNPGRLLS